MPSVARTPAPDHRRYSEAELIECRRVAASLCALFKNKKWLGAHAVEGIDAISLGEHLPTPL
jgi:hypothetical protein